MRFGSVFILITLNVLIVPAMGSDSQPIVVASGEWSKNNGGNGHFYEAVFAPDGITWGEARQISESQGGHLAAIESNKENEFVYRLIRRDSNRGSVLWYKDQHDNYIGPWLGGYQISGSTEPNGGWAWTPTGKPISFQNWAPNEPNNSGNENRIVYFNPFQWSDCPSGCIEGWITQPLWNDFPQNGRPKGYIIEYE